MAPRPRGRPQQGNARIDAALDYASGQLGFPEQMVRETVTELLNVYGGTVGWPFIEDNSYSVLVEVMLAKQQNPPQVKEKEDHFQENATRVGDTETSSAATAVTRVTEASSSNPAQASNASCSASQTNDDENPSSPGDVETGGKDSILPDHGESSRPDQSDPVGSSSMGPSMIQTSQPAQSFPLQRRRPCYGWISDDDHDDDDLVHLQPAPLPEELEKLLGQKATSGFVHPTQAPLPKGPDNLPDQSASSQSGRQRRRKSRWDEKPEDS